MQEVDFGDGTLGYATDGTPVDCVRLAKLGLVEGFEPDVVVSGINHGANLGDDITYSGTVAAALEGIVLGIPGIAVSQQSARARMDFRFGQEFDFTVAADFAARVVDELDDVPGGSEGDAAERQRPRRPPRRRDGRGVVRTDARRSPGRTVVTPILAHRSRTAVWPDSPAVAVLYMVGAARRIPPGTSPRWISRVP